MRLQSFLSQSGIASRRKVVSLIEEGKVKVNDEIIKEPGHPIDPNTDHVTFDGKHVSSPKRVVYLFHKPVNVITTSQDEHGRKSVNDFFAHMNVRLFAVGRLDRQTSGLLLMTNDGDLAHRLMHPRFGVTKRYAVLTDSPLSPIQMKKFKNGIRLEDKQTAHCHIFPHGKQGQFFAYEVVLAEGRNRQIRRMMEILGKTVKGLHRFQYGSLTLSKLKAGEYRLLTQQEVQAIQEGEGHAKGSKQGATRPQLPKGFTQVHSNFRTSKYNTPGRNTSHYRPKRQPRRPSNRRR